jgi:hypothetical protein
MTTGLKRGLKYANEVRAAARVRTKENRVLSYGGFLCRDTHLQLPDAAEKWIIGASPL